MNDKNQEMIDKLILEGALEVAGLDQETGDFLYQFTQKLKDISPELYEEHINHVNTELMKLWEKGFLNINMMDENPIVTLTEKALDLNELSALSKEDRWGLEEIKRLLKSQEL
jgi:hypothetical protein